MKYGNVAKRLFVVGSGPFSKETLGMCKKFNTLRNYRKAEAADPIQIIRCVRFPEIFSLGEGDVCVLLTHGRCVDHATLTFTQVCICRGIPVYFIRSNSYEHDARAPEKWKYNNVITVDSGSQKRCFNPPEKYFMQIEELDDLIPVKNFGFAALLPAMCPMT